MRKKLPIFPKGVARNVYGNFDEWAAYNNITDTVIVASVTDGTSVIGISDFTYTGTEFSFIATASEEGKAIVAITASSAIQGDIEQITYLFEVKDYTKLPARLSGLRGDYGIYHI